MQWLLDELNDRQKEAVTTTEGPLLVIAGAGSGKTRVLTRRLAYILVNRLATPSEILAVTFTNKAAGEMKERVAHLMGGGVADMYVSTFHSFCARLLRREAGAIGYDTSFSIFDSADSLTLVKNCIKELGISEQQFPPKAQLGKISDAKNKLLTPEQYAAKAAGYFEGRTSEIYSLYQRRLRQCGGMDFDDLLFNTVAVLRGVPEIGQKYRHRFKYVMVDEFQDTNHVQYLLLKTLLGENKNICVVGDEDQSIYGWRGADIRNILHFETDFPGAKIIKLEQNYRSTGAILKAASSVIRNNSMRKDKTLWTSEGEGDQLTLYLVDTADREAEEVTTQIVRNRPEVPLKETVVLYRTNAQSRAFEEQLRRSNLPYQIIGGLGFYERKEIKDLVAYLKLIANPKDDISFARIVNYPKRGIGDRTVDDIVTIARGRQISCFEITTRASEFPELGGKLNRIVPFVTLIEKYQQKATTQPVDLLIQDLVEDLKFLEELRDDDPVLAQTKVENVEAFIEGAAEFVRSHAETSLAEYLADISLFTDLDTYREIEDKVTLMTIHGAKGLEFNTVFLVGLEEGLFPMQRSMNDPSELEEERRLFYVGATRARKRLVLTSAHLRHRFGEVEALPSRFIREIPKEILQTRDLRTYRRHEYGTVASHGHAQHGSAKQTITEGVHYVYDENETMQVGRIVSHPTFGRGKIIKSEGLGESLRLEIMFTGVGVKKIMARFAKLKVVG